MAEYDPETFEETIKSVQDKMAKNNTSKNAWDSLSSSLSSKQKGKIKPINDLNIQELASLGKELNEIYGGGAISQTVKFGKEEITMRMKGFLLDGDEKPAIIQTSEGVIVREMWYKNGLPHREDGPAMISYTDEGQKLDEIFIKDGKIQKTISYFSDGFYKVVEQDPLNGNTIMESYDKDGKLHAEVGPARKIITKFGELEMCEFFQHGVIHNTLEPARQTVYGNEYFVQGVKYTNEQFKEYKQTGKTLNSLTSNNNNQKTSSMKDKLGKAGTRIATRKLVKGLQNLLADQMTSNIKNAKTRSAAKEGILSFLESDAGKGALGILLGSLLPYAKNIPMISKHGDKLDMVAEEFQVEGMAVVGEYAVDQLAELVGPATSLIQAYLESISSEEEETTTKVRVDATVTDTAKHEEHEEEAHSHKEKLTKGKKN